MKLHRQIGILTLLAGTAAAQTAPRILTPIDDRATVRLARNVHPLARPEFEAGAMASAERMDRMILVFRLDPAAQAELDTFVAEQHDPGSPLYQKWLTPDEFGRRFGIADADLNQVTGWLTLHGFQLEEIPDGRRSLIFGGSVGQVEEAFHTQMRYYRVNGALHRANATDPEIPAALSGVVAGIASLHDFESSHGAISLQPSAAQSISIPEMTSGSTHYMAPADLATIYDINPLYASSINGAGQTIAVVARSNINLSDVQTFRSMTGLPVNNPAVVLNGANPGVIAGGEQQEATLDAEWAGVAARNAAVKFVVSGTTSASDGVALSAQYIVNHNLAPVMTTSFGLCEQAAGSAGSAFWNSLWQQAAAQGITSLVAAGDNGAAGCDAPSETKATGPLGVNAIASSPYAVAVGGTQFNDATASQYWSASNSGVYGSALGYIPESVWNQSGAVAGGSQLWAGSGGASTIYARPSWQTRPGVPTDTHRHVPDVSLAASTHDGYIVYMNGSLWAMGGTSASAPSWAGIIALIDQRSGSAQGNANPTLYALLGRQFNGGAAVFHDIASGNNSVPGLTGYAAGIGYDQASGLGTPDVLNLVQHWSDATAPSMTLGLSAASVTVQAGAPAQVQITTAASGSFRSAVALTVNGQPGGLTAGFSASSVASPGSGSSTLTLTASPTLAAGSYTLTVSASGGGITQTAQLSVKVNPPFQLASSKATITLTPGTSTSFTVTGTAASGFSSSVTLALSGLPTGVTAAISPATILGSGAKSSTVTITAKSTTKTGVSTLALTGTGGGATVTAPLTLSVIATSNLR